MNSQQLMAKKHIYEGNQYYFIGDYKNAEIQYSLAINADIKNEEIHYKRALCFIWQKNTKLAQNDIDTLEQLNSKYATNLYTILNANSLATQAFQQNNKTMAESHLTTLLQFDPFNVGAIANRAVTRFRLDNYKGFDKDCMLLISLNIDSQQYQNALKAIKQWCSYMPADLNLNAGKIKAFIEFKLNQENRPHSAKNLLDIVQDKAISPKDGLDIFAFFMKHGLLRVAKQVMHGIEVRKDTLLTDAELQRRFTALKDEYTGFTVKTSLFKLFKQAPTGNFKDIAVISENATLNQFK